jgi:hypothetical protein
MMSKFTPGPWKIVAPRHNEPNGVNGAKIWSSTNLPVCGVPRRADRPLDQKKADLSLIAAAPDMYEALKEIERHHVEQNRMKMRPEENSHTLHVVRAALDKADGKEQS